MSETTNSAKSAASEAEKRTRMRSPSYPYINLETAVKRAREFWMVENRNSAPMRIAAKHWGYEEKSSGAAQTAAALISFGLMQDEGTGEKRRVRLTPAAQRILLDERPDSSDRNTLIKQAALAPKIHKDLWQRWGANLPSNESLKHTLIFDWTPPFNPAAVEGFIKEYKDTVSYAKLSDSDSLSSEEEDSSGSNADEGSEGDTTEARESDSAREKPERNEGRRPSMSEEVFTVPEGKVTMNWPMHLSTTSVEDLQDWLELIKRKIGRSLQSKPETAE